MAQPELRFVVLSDIHIPPFPNSGRKVFAHALEVIARTVPRPDLLILDGDVVYQLDSWQDNVCRNVYEHPYDIVRDLLDQHFPGVPRMYVLGNHEFPQNNDDPVLTRQALEVWLRKTCQPVRDHQVIGGIHFIKYPLLTWSMPPMPEQEAWAMAELQAALDADPHNPVFFVSHDSTGDPSYLWPESESFTPEFRAFLRRHPRIVHLSGHRHMHIADRQRIYQDGFTTISLPCCSVGQIVLQVTHYPHGRFKASQSMVFEVSGGRVTAQGIDHALGGFAGEPLVIDTAALAQGIAPYGDEARRRVPVPEFAPDAELTTDGTSVTVPQHFADGSPFPFYYEITVTDAAGQQAAFLRCSTDFDAVFRGQEALPVQTYPLPALPAGAYTLSVRPLNSLRMGGTAKNIAFTAE
ncbi:MAG: metallophosphoesterase [Clostridia bacterium]|nr:metallophosphoesterase [Clostridia bacterium]